MMGEKGAFGRNDGHKRVVTGAGVDLSPPPPLNARQFSAVGRVKAGGLKESKMPPKVE